MNSNDPCLWRNPTLIKNEKKKIVKIIEIDEFFRHLEILEILICSLKGRCGHFDPKFFGLRYILQCKLLWNSTILGLMFTHEESFMCQNVLRFYRLWHKFWFSWVFFFSTSKNDRIEENDLYKFSLFSSFCTSCYPLMNQEKLSCNVNTNTLQENESFDFEKRIRQFSQRTHARSHKT